MISAILKMFNYKIMYVYNNVYHSHRYDCIDYHMMRPIHNNMSVAHPNSKMKLVRIIK